MYRNILLLAVEFLIFWPLHNAIANPVVGDNARTALIFEFPAVVCLAIVGAERLNITMNSGNDILCSGSLISEHHILTAEHCFNFAGRFKVQAIIGSSDMRLGIRYDLIWWITHNQWATRVLRRTRYRDNDISIMKTLLPVPETIPPFELTTAPKVSLFGSEAVLAGWGRLSDGRMPLLMQTGTVTVISDQECLQVCRTVIHLNINTRLGEFCSSSTPYLLLDNGDSGGPIFSRNTLLGVNLATFPASGQVGDQVNIHASVKFYRNFINEMLED